MAITVSKERLNVTEMDFDQIKANLKTFLRAQSTLADYDYEGSALSTIIDVLAYNTFYNAFNANLNINEMLSPRRSRSLARPRQIAMYLAKQHTTKSLPEIGRNFSNRDHTTVIHAVKKIEELIKKDNEIKHNISEIKKKFL